MIRFDQTYVQDGQICGSVNLNGESIGEFRVSVSQWDDLKWSAYNEVVVVMNAKQVSGLQSGKEASPA